jgi:FMN phosphatase YigB (HAD superfamily)
MNRPLLITDCDEVLLHMMAHFADWLHEQREDYVFRIEEPDYSRAVRSRATGQPIPQEEIWPLLDTFFDTEMHRQNIVPGASEALARIAEMADVVVLTNLGNEYHANRVEQLQRFDIRHEVLCNHGGKGKPVRELVDRMQPSATVFVDDFAIHHESVAELAPEVWRLHMIAEPRMATVRPHAPHAHARIDHWNEALPWIIDKLVSGAPAP